MTIEPIPYVLQKVVDAVSAEMLPKLIGLIPNCEGVRFDYGYPSEVIGRTAQMTTTLQNRVKKYPLIGLFLNIGEQRATDVDVLSSAKLTIFFCANRDPKFDSKQSYQNILVPILEPIYNSFLKHLGKSKDIIKPNAGLFKHGYSFNPNWGKEGFAYFENGKKNVFNDFLDCILITDLEIKIKQNC